MLYRRKKKGMITYQVSVKTNRAFHNFNMDALCPSVCVGKVLERFFDEGVISVNLIAINSERENKVRELN